MRTTTFRWQIQPIRKNACRVCSKPAERTCTQTTIQQSHSTVTILNRFRFESIYRLLSPYKTPIGLALYFEPTVGDQETELEWKIILQKNWLEDRLVWALNINYELEFEKEEEDEWERAGVFEWFTGISYRFMRNWSGGLEFWNHHEFANATIHEHSAYFVGPTIHYGGERWWASVGFLRQLPIGQAFSQDNKEFAAHDGYIFGDEHEGYYVRLKVGINF